MNQDSTWANSSANKMGAKILIPSDWATNPTIKGKRAEPAEPKETMKPKAGGWRLFDKIVLVVMSKEKGQKTSTSSLKIVESGSLKRLTYRRLNQNSHSGSDLESRD